MKKLNKTICTVLSVLSLLAITSCYSEVFYNISKDVPPEDATITGPINSIARYTVSDKEFIVVNTNGHLCYKLADKDNIRDKIISQNKGLTGNVLYATSWSTYNIPQDVFIPHKYDYYGDSGTAGHIGQQIIKILSDEENLYLVTAEYHNDYDEGTSVPKKIHLWSVKIPSLNADNATWAATTSADWKDLNTETKDYLPTYAYSSYYHSAFNVFSTNSVKKDHRKVFIRYGSTSDTAAYTDLAFKTDLSQTEIYTIVNNQIVKCENAETEDYGKYVTQATSETQRKRIMKNANSAVWFNGEYKLFNTPASITNETIDSDPDILYYSFETKLCYLTLDSSTSVTLDSAATNNISCFAITKDSLVIGCANFNSTYQSQGGLCRATLDAAGIPLTISDNFQTNATTQIPNTYFILTLLNTDPRKTELMSSIYTSISFITSGTSSSVSYDNIGLWAYYPSRGNWNRE